MALEKLKALRALRMTLSNGRRLDDETLPLGALALTACADYVLREENFVRFAEWAASRPADSPYAWSDPAMLRKDLETGRSVVQETSQLLPLVIGALYPDAGGR